MFNFLEESKPASQGIGRRLLKQDIKNVWIIHQSAESSSQAYPSRDVTAAIYDCLCSNYWTQERDFTIESFFFLFLFLGKGTTYWRQGPNQAITPSTLHTDLQIKLNKRTSHTGQRSWGHVTCHAAFHLHRWVYQSGWHRCKLHALFLNFSFQKVHLIYTVYIYKYTLYMICFVDCKCII